MATTRWAPFWNGKRLYVMSDNQAAVGMLNRGTAKHPLVVEALRWLCWLSATHGFHLTARSIPGIQHTAADGASHLLEPGQLARLTACLPVPAFDFIPSGILQCRPVLVIRYMLIFAGNEPSNRASPSVVEDLDVAVAHFRSRTFAPTTNRTYIGPLTCAPIWPFVT